MRLDNVMFCYTKIQEPSFKYESDTEKEWSVDCVISEDQADAWDAKYKKQSAKVIKTADFEGIYKVAPPFPDERKQYVVKLKKPCQYKDKVTGALIPVAAKYHPRVFTRNEDGSLNDITSTTLVANGSTGSVSFEENVSQKYGVTARLKAILVTDLIEYVAASTASVADDFGGVVKQDGADDFEAEAAQVEEEVAPKAVKPKPRAKPVVEDDDYLPFN